MRRCVLVLALIALCGPAAAQDGRIILAPVTVERGTWEGSFVLQEPARGVRIRYASSQCLSAPDDASTILGVSDTRAGDCLIPPCGRFSETWMAVQRGSGLVEAARLTPPMDLPAGTYKIHVAAGRSGRPVKTIRAAVCVGVGNACAPFAPIASPGC